MQINRINMMNYNSKVSRVSFGEAEGPQFCDECNDIFSREDYERRRQNINYDYDSKRKWLLENNGNKDSAFYKNAVKNIEDLRANALRDLEKLFRKSFPKI